MFVLRKMFSCLSEPETLTYPKHIAIIPDGNRRYSKRLFQNSISGYKDSSLALERLMKWCLTNTISELSVFAWSSENWLRPEVEISSVMQQFDNTLDKWSVDKQEDIAFYFVSTSPEKLKPSIREKMLLCHTKTQQNSKLKVYIYISYGFSEDIEAKQDGSFRSTSAVPEDASDPDMLIRTSGEQRLSNFCMWHLRYTELIFIKPLFPECDEEVWNACVEEYTSRQRHFGQ